MNLIASRLERFSILRPSVAAIVSIACFNVYSVSTILHNGSIQQFPNNTRAKSLNGESGSNGR